MDITTTYTADDVRAAHFAQISPEGPFEHDYPDDPNEREATQTLWNHGMDLLKTTHVVYSSPFPFGADPYAARLKVFQATHPRMCSDIVEVDSGYVGTSLERCYMALEAQP